MTKFLVGSPVLSLHEKCSQKSPFVSQAIYGHPIQLVKKKGNNWGLVETEDSYQGYALLSGLIADNPRWRHSTRLCQVSSLSGAVYPIAHTEKPALMHLPFGAQVELLHPLDSNQDRWLEVVLASGKHAWMQRGDVEKRTTKSFQDALQLAHRFIERPYIWGGNSSQGFDCSGFVQTLCKQMGVLLPRDSHLQAASDKVIVIETPKQPGDLVFFGKDTIKHVGLYLGNKTFIHAGVLDNLPKVAISSIENSSYQFIATRRLKPITYQATISPITQLIQKKMHHSWQSHNPVPLHHLRYIQLSHWGFDGCSHTGELIVHHKVAEEVVELFKELFTQRYPIEKMLLIDNYQANDALSCQDNNSSAFCSRLITGSQTEWSSHSFGLAIDINPLFNPYKKGNTIVPQNAEPFLDRSIDCHGIIDENDACYKAFSSRKWKWGGHWAEEKGYVDYHHFYKEIPL